MAYLSRTKKEDLFTLAWEMELDPTADLRVAGLKELIMNSKGYDEICVKGQLETIVSSRRELEDKEAEEKRREFELERLKLEAQRPHTPRGHEEGRASNNKRELARLMPRFEPKEGDILLYLSLFERQARGSSVSQKDWVSCLLTLLPSDIVQLIARESEEEFDDYEHIKELLLKRFKLNPEEFRKKFVQHQRVPDKSWRTFAYELTNYFEEWIDGLGISTFEDLQSLMIASQLKRRVPTEVREHFIDEWAKIVSPSQLADKLDEYESVRSNLRPAGRDLKEKRPERIQLRSPTKPSYSGHRGLEGVNRFKKTYPSHNSRYVGPKPNYKPTCFSCGSEGHLARSCTKKKFPVRNLNTAQGNLVKTEDDPSASCTPVLTARVTIPESVNRQGIDELKIVYLKCGNVALKAIVDTGAQVSVVRADLVHALPNEGEGKIKIVSAFGETETTPLKIFELKIDDNIHAHVPVTCAVSKRLISDMLICQTAYEALLDNVELHGPMSPPQEERTPCIQEGTVMGKVFTLQEWEEGDIEEAGREVSNVTSCDDGASGVKGQGESCCVNRSAFIALQKEDQTLKDTWEQARKNANSFHIEEGMLVRKELILGEQITQVVLPECKRTRVLEMAHDISLAGHLGETKTRQRIKYSFYWPSIKQDVRKYCESCKQCQLRRTVTYRDRVPIQPLVRPENPFEVWSLDCIGPLEPASRRGHRYIICAVDLCTRWAEAVPVKEISAKTTCGVLMKVFTQTGFPRMICSDQGSNFTAKLTAAFTELLGISPRFSTPGHPESMGAVERWNKTLKNMLNKNIQENGRNWDVHIPFLLFAYREVPHSTTGVSPFQLVYGRVPPGPLSMLKDVWAGKREIPTDASRAVETYLQDLVEKVQNAHAIASETAEASQRSYTHRYNLRAREKTFTVGDNVLILQPSSTHKLLNTWIGPATIVELTRQHSAKVELEDGSIRELHFNKLRPYVSRAQHIGLIFDEDKDFGDVHCAPTDRVVCSSNDIAEHIEQAISTLQTVQRRELSRVLCRYLDVFNAQLGRARVEGHTVQVTPDCAPKRLRPYRVPIALQNEVDRQIHELLQTGLIEESSSEWAHPVVCVSKKDGSVRLCVDYRLLNKFTVADAYPMQCSHDLLYEMGAAQYITVLDLTKGYWQIPMKEDAKSYTAFVTHAGHYQWKVLPFGMKNAGSTFQKVMDRILSPHRQYCRAYIDDVGIFSRSWAEHLKHIEAVLKTLREVDLRANIKKCEFGRTHVKFLGHIIGSGTHAPDPEKVSAMIRIPRPQTKKELRGVIGLTSYYRDYIHDFANLILPLTNLTKKSVPNQIPWGPVEESAFQKLKQKLVDLPTLFTPKLDRPFQLYTDASATAIGACLSQLDEEGREHPIAYYSKKLTPCQVRWSTIEREAYGVIASLQKFDTWIFGAKIEVVSDHNPLTYLTQGLPHGAKLTRWALALQRYNLKISYRKGSQHGNADALSRLVVEDSQ